MSDEMKLAEALRARFTTYQSDQRCHTNAEQAYWLSQWKLLAEDAINALEAHAAETAQPQALKALPRLTLEERHDLLRKRFYDLLYSTRGGDRDLAMAQLDEHFAGMIADRDAASPRQQAAEPVASTYAQIGWVHPAYLTGDRLGMDVSTMRLAEAQLPVFICTGATTHPPAQDAEAKDAARYRWLRSRMDVTCFHAMPSHISMDDILHEGVLVCTDDFIDEAIDVAMAREAGE